MEQRRFFIDDVVIVTASGPDYGKMCRVIAVPSNTELPVRIQLINQHDSFKFDDYGTNVVEKWISQREIKLYVEREYK